MKLLIWNKIESRSRSFIKNSNSPKPFQLFPLPFSGSSMRWFVFIVISASAFEREQIYHREVDWGQEQDDYSSAALIFHAQINFIDFLHLLTAEHAVKHGTDDVVLCCCDNRPWGRSQITGGADLRLDTAISMVISNFFRLIHHAASETTKTERRIESEERKHSWMMMKPIYNFYCSLMFTQ